MRLSPDQLVLWKYGFLELNSTIVTTWVLMLVMTVGAVVDHAQARDRSAYLALARLPRNRGDHHSETDRGSRPRPSGQISGFSGHLVPVHRGVQPLCDRPRIQSADRFALDHVGAGDLGVCRSAVLRYRGARVGRLPEVLPEADVDHVAVQHHQRGVAHVCTGHASIRQHHERDDDCRYLAHDHAPLFPDFMYLLGLLTGMVQAYIFSILATVYIAAATRTREA